MKAWILQKPNDMRLVESAPTKLAENNVKIKVEEVLLTKSEFETYTGENEKEFPFILGRNAVGVVSEVFDKATSMFQKMDRVVVEPYIPCENCGECLQGNYRNCTEMQELGYNCNGLLQNFADLPYTALHRLPDNLSNDRALFVSYVSFCLNVVDALKLEKGRHIAIFSSTKTGLILAQLVAYYQAVPIFISNKEELLTAAREMGVFYCFNPENTEVEREVLVVTGGRMCKEIVFFSDSDFKMKDIYGVAAMNANICLAGYSTKDSRLTIAQICQKHLNIFGVYNGLGNFSSAINLLVTGTVNVDSLIGKTLNFDSLDKQLPGVSADELTLKSMVIKVD